MSYLERVQALPILGVGISTEYGAAEAPDALNIHLLRQKFPQYASLLEVGVETGKGLDASTQRWLDAKLPTTYHFLDVNLDNPEDFTADWLQSVGQLKEKLRPAWMCGDAGLWHFGRRDRGQMLLLPPILNDASAWAMAEGVSRLREAVSLEVLPENPPGVAYIGELHLLDYFAKVCERADTGMVLDCAHLAIYQQMMGYKALDGLKDFPLERVTEIHLAGGKRCSAGDFHWVEDDHTPMILPETWEIIKYVLAGARNLRAVIFECERNPMEKNIGALKMMADLLSVSHPGFVRENAEQNASQSWTPPITPAWPKYKKDHLQDAVVRLLHDPAAVDGLYRGRPPIPLSAAEQQLLKTPDRRVWQLDAHRRARLLHAVIEEYPVSTAILGIDRFDAFFSSEAFQNSIKPTGSMALACGAFVAPQEPLVQLETAIAQCRRAEPQSPEPGKLQTAACVVRLKCPEGTLALYQQIRAELGPDPLPRLIHGYRAKRPKIAKNKEFLAIVPSEEGPVVQELGEAIFDILQYMSQARLPDQVRKELEKMGAETEDCPEIIAGLRADGLVLG